MTLRANLRSIPIETTVVDYAGNIIAGANVVIKRKTPTGSEIVDQQKSDETGFIQSVPLPNGVYDLFYQNLYVGSQHHFHNIDIPSYKALEGNIKPKPTFQVLRNANQLMEYGFYLQIEIVDVSTGGNTYPIYDVDPTKFDAVQYGATLFFGLESTSRLTQTRFDVEYHNPITSENANARNVRCAGVPGIRFFSESQLVVPFDYYSIVLKNQAATYIPPSANATIDGVNIITITDAPEDLLRTANYGDILRIEELGTSTIWYGIIDDITASNEIILEQFKSTRYNSDYSNLSGVDTQIYEIRQYHGLRSLVNASPFDNFTVTENVYAQDVEDIYTYPYSIPMA